MNKTSIIIVLGIVATLLLMSRTHINNIADRLYPVLAQVLPLEKGMIEAPKYRKLADKYKESYSHLDQADYLFLGDSHIQYFNVEDRFTGRKVINYGIAGDTTEGVIKRLPAPASKNKIKQGVLFMVGYNDLKYRDVAKIIGNHRNMLVKASRQLDLPFSKIIFHSLFPVSRERTYVNDSIIRINQAGKLLCAELGCVFLDLYANFTDLHGGLRDLYSKDGVHLNQTGYAIWTALLKQSLNI